MSKKILAFMMVVALAWMCIFMTGCSNSNNNEQASIPSSITNESISTAEQSSTNNSESTGKIAVIYFSASGTTKSVAQTISNETGGELIEIVPKEKYSSADLNYNDSNSRTSIECNDSSSRPEMENTINVDGYDVIYLGYPIWWGDVPHIILTFMDTHKLDGKTVIPFCTSGGTGISQSMNTLKKYNQNVKWVDGARLGSSESEIKSWVKGLNY